MNLKDKIFSSVAVSAFFIFAAFIFAPSQMFLINVQEFNVLYFELLGYLFIVALPFFVIVMLIAFLPKNLVAHQKIVALLLALSFLLWLQGNILVWNYGLLTGGEIDFNIYFLIIDAVVWVAVIILVLMKSAFFYKHVKFVSCLFIAVLIATSVFTYLRTDMPDSNRYEVDVTNEFTFSEEKNVIILVLDAFQSDVFQKIIDEDESYKDIFDGFTYYRDSLSGFPSTYASVPNILTGQYYDNSVPFSDFLEGAFFSPSSIPKVLTGEGFEVDCFMHPMYLDKRVMSNVKDRTGVETTTIIDIYDAALFRYTPDFLKRYIYNDGKWFLKNLVPRRLVVSSDRVPVNVPPVTFEEKSLTLEDVAFINDMMTYSYTVDDRYIFKFYKIEGCHTPYLLNEKLEYEEMEGIDGYTRQAEGSLQIAKIFLDELKRLSVCDNSMIFIIADHGIMAGMEYMQKNAYPLFLVKKFNGMGKMNISDAPVCLSDIPNTIFSELGLMDNVNGKSIFELKDSDLRERRFLYYQWDYAGWSKDYLPTMKEYIVSGHVWESESWQYTGREFIVGFVERPLLEWGGGFFTLEGTIDNTWRWCSSEGTLIINNTSDKDRKLIMIADFSTGHPELSNFKIESTLFNEDLKINNSGYHYEKEITITPGSHAIKFSCDAERVDAPADPRYLVFRIVNFQMVEVE
jgi:hypothetical protein